MSRMFMEPQGFFWTKKTLLSVNFFLSDRTISLGVFEYNVSGLERVVSDKMLILRTLGKRDVQGVGLKHKLKKIREILIEPIEFFPNIGLTPSQRD